MSGLAAPSGYDGLYEMAAVNRPHGWLRAILLGLATPIMFYFQGWAVAAAWIGSTLAVEIARNLLIDRILRGEAAWRGIYEKVCLVTPWSWISFAILLWFANAEAARVCALCALFGTLIYIAVNCHQDKRLLAILFVQPCLALAVFIWLEYAHTMPLWLAPIATLSAMAMLASLAVGAAFMHKGRMELLAARQALQDERDALERKVEERTAELQQSMRAAQAANEAKTRFLATMSHELRTPLNAIINYAQMLEEEMADRAIEAPREDAQRIERAGRHLLDVINDVLDVAKIENRELQLEWDETELAALVDEAVDTVRDLAGKRGNRLAANVDPSIGRISTAPLRLRQALINLMSNACKFTEDGEIAVSASLDGDELVLAVRDTGVGMAEADLQRIFEPFVQLDNSDSRRADGTGLGLFITRNIVQSLGGRIEVKSGPGEGSTFALRLPLRRVLAEMAAA